MCHGGKGDKYEWGRFTKTAEILSSNGYDTLLFDFSGMGKNKREPMSITKQIQNLEDVGDWAIENGYKHLATIGLSLGGLISLLANIDNRSTAIFWAPAFFIKQSIGIWRLLSAKLIFTFRKKPILTESSGNNEPLQFTRKFFEELTSIEIEGKLRNINIPTLIIQGSADKTVDPKYVRKAFEMFPKNKNHILKEIDGAGHDFKELHLDKFINITLNWILHYLPK
jgi:pimeloyl-ACP methyl ester carboxylesterase